MSNPLETATQAVQEQANITKTGTLVLTLAIIGAGHVTKDTVSLVKKVNRNWKARKAAQAEVAETTPQS